uniref:Centrosome-associated protein 350 n=1 Tax=Zeugodacus cucurbitae TaxID=28588 RepID=A0A0A1WMP9_ZEUCU
MRDHQPVWKKSEDSVKKFDTSENVIHHIAASPRQIKTQIAKISYTSTSRTPTKKNKPKESPKKQEDDFTEPASRQVINSTELETRKICPNDNTGVDFVKMKEERDQEFKNLNTYLTEIINNKSVEKSKLNESDTLENKADSSTSKHGKMFRRCRTEMDYKPCTQSERRSKTRVGSIVRSKSSNPPDTSSHEHLPTVSQKVKRKSYNVEEARKFLQDQKRKRRSQQLSTPIEAKGEKNTLEKEQIKLRLEELRKNSRAIITKNVNKKNNASTGHSNQKISLGEIKAKEIMIDPDFCKEINATVKDSGETIEDKNFDPELKTRNVVTNINKVIQNVKTEGNISIIPEALEEIANLKLPEKRIGLLRKPETKDHSFSAIREFNFDKENIALEMMTPKLSHSVPLIPKTTSNDEIKGKDREVIPVEFTYRKPATVTLQNSQRDELKKSKQSKGNEVDSIKKGCDEIQSKIETCSNNITLNDLPYWLKPSAVQIYPYNFIMAVRRKLEALADVRPVNQTDTKFQKTVNTETSGESFSSRNYAFKTQPIVKKPHAAESKYTGKLIETIKIDPERKDYTNCSVSNIHLLQSQSEFNSNLSSISVQLLHSSTNQSKTSSKKSNSIPLTYAKSKASAQASEDDTTISSSIFNSPERNIRQRKVIGKSKFEELQGTISPLSLERVENLTIMSNKKLKKAIAAKHVNPNRGDSQASCKMENVLSHNKSTTNDIDFNKLLNDFNRSLSQVIEVNDRLKTTINKSHEICTEKNNPSEVYEYTTDFEKCSSHQTYNSSLELHNEIELLDAHIETYSEKENLELDYGDKQISKHSKNISKYSYNSNESMKVSKNIESQQEMDRLRKIEKSKERCISSQKYGLSKEYHEGSETCSFNGIYKMFEILKQEKSERAEHLTETLISTNTSEEYACEIPSNITEIIKSKTEKENVHLLSKNLTSSHKILEMFDHSNLEISLGSANNDSFSDSTCSYTNVGMYEKLIRNETTKSEHLAALLKMREKALFDRTKGQIAWLEVQKERCKSKGLLIQIAAIKKKQRGILLKMEKEREEIKRLLQSTTTTSSTESTSNRERNAFVSTSRKRDKSVAPQKTNSKISRRTPQIGRDEKQPPPSQSSSVSSICNNATGLSTQNFNVKVDRPEPVVRANYTLETSRSLEELLEKRELDLQRRRKHVERLMQWHRRLDQEEAEVLQMENKLLSYNTQSQSKHLVTDKTKDLPQDHVGTFSVRNYNAHVKVQRRLKEIKNSLKELHSISSTHTTAGSNEGSGEEFVADAIDCVRTTGTKLNKLWRRLTSQQYDKYEPDKHYKLSKTDLEHLYEAAKVAVLKDFSRNEGRLAAELLEKSIFSYDSNISPVLSNQQKQPEQVLVPSLKLCTSSESDKEADTWDDTSANSLQPDNYSPSTAAEKFQHVYERSSGSATPSSAVTQSLSEANILLTKITSEMRSSAPNTIPNVGLVRSLSDGVLFSKESIPQDRKQEAVNVCKGQCAEFSQKSSTSQIESLSKQDLKSNIPLPLPLNTCSTTYENSKSANEPVFATAGLSCKNACKENETVVLETMSRSTAYNEEYKVSPNQQEILNSFQQNSDKISNDNNNSNSSCTNLDSSRNDNNNSISFTNLDSIKSQTLNDQESFNSKTFISEPKLCESEAPTNENLISKSYGDDFESTGELTQLDDLSLPHFESIVDVSLPGDESNNPDSENVDLDPNEKDNMEKNIAVLFSDSENSRDSSAQQSNSEQIPVPSPPPTLADNVRLQAQDANKGSSASSSAQLMPDIINELEIRRCQQILIEPEKAKQFDNNSTVIPYMYVREIPNKPPPPYVPPAHGSPMTTIFPSEERIREISYRRTHELYCELLKTDYINETGEKLPTVMDEKITNIYERIILDICREYLDEHSEVLTQGDAVNFHTQLAFFNPPNRLHCIQESVYKEVRRCLAMDKTLKRRTPIYSVYGQRANRDHIGKIIIQEMYDEDDKWCNFHREENEVVDLIICEMIGKCLTSIAKEVLIEENGTVDITYRDDEDACDGVSSCSHEAGSKQPNNSVDLLIHDA